MHYTITSPNKTPKKGFSLIEILIAVAIFSILVALGRLSYLVAIARSRAFGCRTNIKIIKKSLDNYTSEFDTFPSSLAQLEPRHLNKAIAEVIVSKEDLLTKLGYFLIGIKEGSDEAFAQRLGLDISAISCPADTTPPPVGISYGLVRMKSADYRDKDPSKDGSIILGDSEKPTLTSLSDISKERHQEGIINIKRFGYFMIKNGQIFKLYLNGTIEPEPTSLGDVKTTIPIDKISIAPYSAQEGELYTGASSGDARGVQPQSAQPDITRARGKSPSSSQPPQSPNNPLPPNTTEKVLPDNTIKNNASNEDARQQGTQEQGVIKKVLYYLLNK